MQNLTAPEPTATKWVSKLPSFTAIADRKLRLIDASTGWFEFFSLNRTQVIGKSIISFFPHFENEFSEKITHVFEGKHDVYFKDTVKYRSNQGQDIKWHLSPWKDGYGNVIGIVLKIAMNNGTNPLKEIIEDSVKPEAGSWEVNLENDTMVWSNAFKQLIGAPLTYEGSLKRAFALIENKESLFKLKNILRDAITTGRSWEEVFNVVDFKGNAQQLKVVGRPKFKRGKCVKIIGIIEPYQIIEEQKLAPSKQQTTESQPSYFDEIPTGLLVIDYKEGKILKVNGYLQRLFDKKESFFKDKSFNEFISLDPMSKAEIKDSLVTQFSFSNIAINIKHRNLSSYVFNVSGNLTTDAQGKELLIVSCDDFTKRYSLEYTFSENLNKAHQEIDKMVHFAHMVSHNLKAHTTNFDLLLNFLQDEKDEEERNHLIHMLFESSDSLTKTIKSLRELVAIRQMVNEQKSELKLNEFIYKVLQSNNGVIKKLNAKVHNEIDDDFTINAIPAYLESILANLLLNALHFVNENERPMVFVYGEVEDSHRVIVVEDNSMGINLEKEGDKVFALYRKLQNMGENTSMGLYLTKYQTELMGGRITVESEVGKGNVFKVYFPN